MVLMTWKREDVIQLVPITNLGYEVDEVLGTIL